MLACLDRGSRTLLAVQAADRFGISVLHAGQEPIARAFATKAPVAREVGPASSGATATASRRSTTPCSGIACDLRDVISAGDHVIVTGEVTRRWRPARATRSSSTAASTVHCNERGLPGAGLVHQERLSNAWSPRRPGWGSAPPELHWALARSKGPNQSGEWRRTEPVNSASSSRGTATWSRRAETLQWAPATLRPPAAGLGGSVRLAAPRRGASPRPEASLEDQPSLLRAYLSEREVTRSAASPSTASGARSTASEESAARPRLPPPVRIE